MRKDPKYTVTIAEARVYRLRTDQNFGWADITVREWPKGGAIDVQSDYGNYSYSWSSIGDGTLRAFLRTLHFDYFMGKAKPNFMEFDADASADEVRRQLLQRRTEREISATDAREMFDQLEALRCARLETEFGALIDDNFRGLYEWAGDAPYLAKPSAQAVAFWENVWPVACAYWADELALVAA